jgi:hypothetical protein
MRFAGPQILSDPSLMPRTASRYAGRVMKDSPGLVERITNAIIPGHGAVNPGGKESSIQG